MIFVFRCEEHLYKRLRWSVGPSVRPSVPHDARLRGKIIVTLRLIREEEEEETGSTHPYMRVCLSVSRSVGPSDGNLFLDASSHLYKSVCLSVGPSVRRSVRRMDGNLLFQMLEIQKSHIGADQL